MNKELPGFTLTSPGNGWTGGRDTWSVIDPRGFETEITAGNLAQIMSCTGITKGLIQDKCVWGYQGDVVLLPVNSKPYLEAQVNTEVLDKRVEKKKYIFEFYKRELGQLVGVLFMPIKFQETENILMLLPKSLTIYLVRTPPVIVLSPDLVPKQ